MYPTPTPTIVMIPLKLLPAIVAELWDRFNELFCEFTQDKRREHRNELVFLLDELKRQKGVCRKKYTRLNNSLSESLDDAEYGEEEMGEDDSNEKEMVVDDEEDYLITLINLEELIGKFLTYEFEDGKPVLAVD